MPTSASQSELDFRRNMELQYWWCPVGGRAALFLSCRSLFQFLAQLHTQLSLLLLSSTKPAADPRRDSGQELRHKTPAECTSFSKI